MVPGEHSDDGKVLWCMLLNRERFRQHIVMTVPLLFPLCRSAMASVRAFLGKHKEDDKLRIVIVEGESDSNKAACVPRLKTFRGADERFRTKQTDHHDRRA